MRIITERTLHDFAHKHVDLASAFEEFIKKLRNAEWRDVDQLRGTFPHADKVKVASGRTVYVINVGGNKCRVVTALHFNRGVIYILAVLTHAEYSRAKWKEKL